jgi:hypothetical protein
MRIPLGNTPRAFFDFRDLTYFVAWLGHQWAKTKNTKSAITPEVICWISSKFLS